MFYKCVDTAFERAETENWDINTDNEFLYFTMNGICQELYAD